MYYLSGDAVIMIKLAIVAILTGGFIGLSVLILFMLRRR